MRRVYKKNNKSILREKALEQMRETRSQIEAHHPDLLDQMRETIESHAWDSMPDDYEVKIDRKKNLEAVMMFLEIKDTHTPKFQSQIRRIIQETGSLQ